MTMSQCCSSLGSRMVALVYRVREETRKLEAASSNRGAGYWITFFKLL